MCKPLDDPLIDEIRRVRHEISAECDHDPDKLVEHYIRLQDSPEFRGPRASESDAAGPPA